MGAEGQARKPYQHSERPEPLSNPGVPWSVIWLTTQIPRRFAIKVRVEADHLLKMRWDGSWQSESGFWRPSPLRRQVSRNHRIAEGMRNVTDLLREIPG